MADEEEVARVEGTEVADGVVVEAKVLIQEVGRYSAGTVDTPQEVQEVREAGGY